jgi:ATP-dependent protease ClpP protease subunit
MNTYRPWVDARKIVALSTGKAPEWYKIKNLANGPTQLYIYDEIGYFGLSASDLARELAEISGPVDCHINSPGGEVFDGITIYNCLQARGDVDVYIDGLAASIASVIAMAGRKVFIAKNARFMVHDGFSMAAGNASDMREMADRLDDASNNIASIYAERTGDTVAHWREIMRGERWYTAQAAIDAGLADSMIVHGSVAETREDASNHSHTPMTNHIVSGDPTQTGLSNAASHPYHSEHSMMHEPMTGTHAHNHACFECGDGDDGVHQHAHMHDNDAVHNHGHMTHSHSHDHGIGDGAHDHAHEAGQSSYGAHSHDHVHHNASGHIDPDHDGDNDATAAGDTDHDYWAGPVTNAADKEQRAYLRAHIDLHDASYDSTPWDGSAAMSAAAHSDNPASALSAICAGRRSGDASTEAAHALPHHKHPGSPPNKAGVTAALGRLNQTQGLSNKSAAEAHLKAHASAWASGSEDHDHTDIGDGPWINPTDEEIANWTKNMKGIK